MMQACSVATQSSDEYSCNPPNCFYPHQQPQRFLTRKGREEVQRNQHPSTNTSAASLPPNGMGYSHCQCLKPSHHSKPSLPWPSTPQRSPGEVPIPQAGSELNHRHRAGRSTWCSMAEFHPCSTPPAAGVEAERVSGTRNRGDGALPTSVNAAFLSHH